MTSSADFDDIRPYQDHEVTPTVARLLSDNEFLDTIARLKIPRFASFASFFIRPLVRKILQWETRGVTTVHGFQLRLAKYMQNMLDRTTSELTISGLEKLSKDQAYCFVSNHRDIAMDPAFVNWVLHHNGFQTLRIAIGDNLLTKSFASDIMRLNKCFIVNRSIKAPREKLKAARTLSRYIHSSVAYDKANIWIAQREGRAKNGLDVTNPAIVSMLLLAKEKDEALGHYLDKAKIVPLSISYEWDPCDVDKARELTLLKRNGSYEKGEHEDVKSILKGISGLKGRVHLAFGEPLPPSLESDEQMVANIDAQILDNYLLQPSNFVAYELLEGFDSLKGRAVTVSIYADSVIDEARQKMQLRLEQCDPDWRDMLLRIYANPVYAKLASKSQ